MKIEDAKIGDLVRLLSTPEDGPMMTVVCVRRMNPQLDPLIICAWQEPDGTCERGFPPETLRKAAPVGPARDAS
jgi:hypothetical protein